MYRHPGLPARDTEMLWICDSLQLMASLPQRNTVVWTTTLWIAPTRPGLTVPPFFFSQLDGRRPCEKQSNYSTFYNMALCIREEVQYICTFFLSLIWKKKKKKKMKQGHRPLSGFKHFTRKKKASLSCPENNAGSCQCVTSLVLKELSCTGNWNNKLCFWPVLPQIFCRLSGQVGQLLEGKALSR